MKLDWTLILPLMIAAGCESTSDSTTHSYGAQSGPSMSASADDDGDEEDIPISEVPANVLEAALRELPGFVLVSAERETENGVLQYCLEGTVNGEPAEVEVSADGTSVNVEDDDDDDGDDDDDDDEDDEDEDD